MQGNDIVNSLRVESKGQDFHFYLTGPVEDPDNYTDLFHVFNMASPADIIYLHLNTPGEFWTQPSILCMASRTPRLWLWRVLMGW